jgi:hypothetical protein
MRVENITSKPRDARYLNASLTVFGLFALLSSLYVAWPALAHLGGKIL